MTRKHNKCRVCCWTKTIRKGFSKEMFLTKKHFGDTSEKLVLVGWFLGEHFRPVPEGTW